MRCVSASGRCQMALAKDIPSWEGSALDDPAFREWLADYYVQSEAIRLLSFRTLSSLSKGEAPGPASSAGKLLWSNTTQEMTSRALDLLKGLAVFKPRRAG